MDTLLCKRKCRKIQQLVCLLIHLVIERLRCHLRVPYLIHERLGSPSHFNNLSPLPLYLELQFLDHFGQLPILSLLHPFAIRGRGDVAQACRGLHRVESGCSGRAQRTLSDPIEDLVELSGKTEGGRPGRFSVALVAVSEDGLVLGL